jgi:hypothetical protein
MSGARRAYDLLRGYINREWDRIQGVEELDARRELDQASRVPDNAGLPPIENQDPMEKARRILGVAADANYETIRKAFERLHQRSDPSNFPDGSEEQRRAESIHKRVMWAYRTLSESVTSSEKRFRNLELE